MKINTKFLISLAVISLAFLLPAVITGNGALFILFACAIIFALVVYAKGLHRIDFDPKSHRQKWVFAVVTVILILFSFFVCAVSIEDEWMHEYPFEGSVDDFGCYPQMFDAFQKGQLNIDTEYDLSIIEALENPYDPYARWSATGEKHGVIWDRAYFDGKLYSYFGIAPVIFLYYPFYFLTGHVPSDALAAAIIVAICCVFLMLILWELCARIKGKIPFLLMLLSGITLPFGALLWSTETCANFYHLAVLSGICSVLTLFYFVLRAEKAANGIKRRLFFGICGIAIAAIVASRPNMVIYVLIPMPLLVNIIIKRPYGSKSLAGDIISFCLPMLCLGGSIMWYNYARFGSVFDFGADYQLTLTDTSAYSLTGALFMPSIFHFFFNIPSIDSTFPYIHPAGRILNSYGVDRFVYISKTIGAFFFPTVWGCALLPILRKNKKQFIMGIAAIACVIFVAFFDMCYGGVHLRYTADIMFVLTLLGVYMLISAISNAKKGSTGYTVIYMGAILLLAYTVMIELPLCFDNERNMIMKFHREFYDLIAA